MRTRYDRSQTAADCRCPCVFCDQVRSFSWYRGGCSSGVIAPRHISPGQPEEMVALFACRASSSNGRLQTCPSRQSSAVRTAPLLDLLRRCWRASRTCGQSTRLFCSARSQYDQEYTHGSPAENAKRRKATSTAHICFFPWTVCGRPRSSSRLLVPQRGDRRGINLLLLLSPALGIQCVDLRASAASRQASHAPQAPVAWTSACIRTRRSPSIASTLQSHQPQWPSTQGCVQGLRACRRLSDVLIRHRSSAATQTTRFSAPHPLDTTASTAKRNLRREIMLKPA